MKCLLVLFAHYIDVIKLIIKTRHKLSLILDNTPLSLPRHHINIINIQNNSLFNLNHKFSSLITTESGDKHIIIYN